jgi:hypothetical protein
MWKVVRAHRSTKARCAAVAVLIAIGISHAATLGAQQRREALRVVLDLVPLGDGRTADVTVSLYNVSNRIVNIFVPNRIGCETAAGEVSIEWKIKATELGALATQGIQSTCVEPPPGLSGSQDIERQLKQRRTWMHFVPGQHAEVHDTLALGGLVAGKYEVRAVYTSPAFTVDQRQDILNAGLETPSGKYKSEWYGFSVSK